MGRVAGKMKAMGAAVSMTPGNDSGVWMGGYDSRILAYLLRL